MDFEIKSFDGMDWYSVDAPGFELDGFYWRSKGGIFRRLPESVTVSPAVDELAWHTAGAMVRFCTDAAEIRISAKLWHNSRMDHMASTGSMGFDLYVMCGAKKLYCRTTRFDRNNDEYVVTVFGPDAEIKMREFTLHFPLYCGVESLQIGITSGSRLAPPSPWRDSRPVVVYGTSIQQGGCASRPGMCHTNIMSRMLNRKFLNFSFSGSAQGETAIAEALAEIADPAMYILDYDANAQTDGLEATLSSFIDILRAKHPAAPILLVSKLPFANEFYQPETILPLREKFTRIHKAELKRRQDAGDTNIYFLDGRFLYGDDPSECTVDGVHATDFGFYQIAKNMAPEIERILNITK